MDHLFPVVSKFPSVMWTCGQIFNVLSSGNSWGGGSHALKKTMIPEVRNEGGGSHALKKTMIPEVRNEGGLAHMHLKKLIPEVQNENFSVDLTFVIQLW